MGPRQGSATKTPIEASIAHSGRESYGQFPPILTRLAAGGLAARRREKQRGKPDRHVYSLTPRGREELERWLALPARLDPVRSELLLKLFLGGAGSVANSIAPLAHVQARQRALPVTYAAISPRL